MANLPSAIIFVNQDITGPIQGVLETQLYIDETISGSVFNQRVSDGYDGYTYPDDVRGNNLRILVIQEDFRDTTNRNLADVVIFVKQGMATILKNNLGPPTLSLPVARLNIYALLRGAGSAQVVILPTNNPPCGPRLGGIFAIQLADQSGVHDVNPDNEAHNIDFINRK